MSERRERTLVATKTVESLPDHWAGGIHFRVQVRGWWWRTVREGFGLLDAGDRAKYSEEERAVRAGWCRRVQVFWSSGGWFTIPAPLCLQLEDLRPIDPIATYSLKKARDDLNAAIRAGGGVT